jgi:hypothetical protein
LIRKGASNNAIVFPGSDYDNSAFGFSNGQYTFSHKAYGADMFRYSWNYGRNWTQWNNWEDTTYIDSKVFSGADNFWTGQHIMVQCECVIAFTHTDTETMIKIGAPSRHLPRLSFMQIEVTILSVACRSSSFVDRSTLGALTRESLRK